MDDYSNEEDSTNFPYGGEDFPNCPPEVKEGLFSKCEKKSEEKKETKKHVCGCAPKEKPKPEVKKMPPANTKSKRPINAFIIFYLEMYKKTCGKHVTCVAKEAGKRWCKLPEKEKEKYRQLARAKKNC